MSSLHPLCVCIYICWVCLSDWQTHKPSGPEELHVLAESKCWGLGVCSAGLRHVQSAAENAVIHWHAEPTLTTTEPNGAILTNRNPIYNLLKNLFIFFICHYPVVLLAPLEKCILFLLDFGGVVRWVVKANILILLFHYNVFLLLRIEGKSFILYQIADMLNLSCASK